MLGPLENSVQTKKDAKPLPPVVLWLQDWPWCSNRKAFIFVKGLCNKHICTVAADNPTVTASYPRVFRCEPDREHGRLAPQSCGWPGALLRQRP